MYETIKIFNLKKSKSTKTVGKLFRKKWINISKNNDASNLFVKQFNTKIKQKGSETYDVNRKI